MRYKIAPLTESLIAHCTRIGDLTTMYTFMSYKTAQVTKCLFTHTTSIRAVTTMYALMCFQIAPMTESLITHCTEIGELTTMIALMFCKTALVTDAHVTHFTGIWMLTPMYITGVPAFSTVYMMMFFPGILVKIQRLKISIICDRRNNYFYSKWIHITKNFGILRTVLFTRLS